MNKKGIDKYQEFLKLEDNIYETLYVWVKTNEIDFKTFQDCLDVLINSNEIIY